MPAFADPEVQASHQSGPSEDQFTATRVFPLIHALKTDVETNIDSALSWDQLTAADVNFTIIKPLVFKYARLQNLATTYSCLVVRSHFLRLSDESLAQANLHSSRAMMCELLAIKLLRHFASNNLRLVAVLTHTWSPLAGAPHLVVDEVKQLLSGDEDDIDDPTSALEMAISTDSKTFLSSPLVQSVVNDIYSGRIVFSTASRHSIIADNYKQRQIEIYDVRKAPFLDHYRLRVPKYGTILEMMNFALLLLFFMLCLSTRDLHKITTYEGIFLLFAVAFVLEEYTAACEHGWRIYMANMWNVFDTSFIVVWFLYLGFRIRGLTQNDDWSNDLAFDVLACGACILFPRLAFFAVSKNVVILALRGMIADFFYFMTIACICFSGLLFTLWELAQLEPGNKWTLQSIAWLLTQIWFGNTSLSFGQASSFHPLFGPLLMIVFAALSNTLLVTILISILTNTFARIDTNATEEHLFQFALSTIEGVKTDALFSYQPPFNLLAYLILAPLSCLVSPRILHTSNVLLIRITSFPILVTISIYERYLASGRKFREASVGTAHTIFNSLPRQVKSVAFLDAFAGSTTNDLYGVLFTIEVPPMALFEELEEEEFVGLRSVQSREIFDKTQAPRLSRTGASAPSSPKLSPSPRLPPSSPGLRSRSRSRQRNDGSEATDAQTSPLARIFTRRPLSGGDIPEGGVASADSVEGALAGIRNVERMLEGMNDLPTGRLRAEMKELQERQARIESLLLTLTRGMRGEASITRSGTH